jgi:hypothetical protein
MIINASIYNASGEHHERRVPRQQRTDRPICPAGARDKRAQLSHLGQGDMKDRLGSIESSILLSGAAERAVV